MNLAYPRMDSHVSDPPPLEFHLDESYPPTINQHRKSSPCSTLELSHPPQPDPHLSTSNIERKDLSKDQQHSVVDAKHVLTSDKGFFLGAVDSFLPAVDGDGTVIHQGNQLAVFTPSDYSVISPTTTIPAGSTSLQQPQGTFVAVSEIGGSAIGGNGFVDPTASAMIVGGSGDIGNGSTNFVTMNSNNVDSAYQTSPTQSLNTLQGDRHHHHPNHDQHRRREQKNHQYEYFMERVKYDRVRQVKIISFFVATLVAILALLGLLFLRYWSRHQPPTISSPTPTTTTKDSSSSSHT